jgi:hypothetical protein
LKEKKEKKNEKQRLVVLGRFRAAQSPLLFIPAPSFVGCSHFSCLRRHSPGLAGLPPLVVAGIVPLSLSLSTAFPPFSWLPGAVPVVPGIPMVVVVLFVIAVAVVVSSWLLLLTGDWLWSSCGRISVKTYKQ